MAINMEKLVKDWFAAWNSSEPENIIQFYADDSVFESVYRNTVANGKNEIVTNLKTNFIDYPDFKIEQKATFYSPNAVCGEVTITATQVHSSNPAMPATGKRYSVRGAYISEWQNGKIKRHAYYQDMMTVMQQLGLMPTPPKK
jgi:steroid delta-isomerase-like uncharacterized protein